MYDFKSNAWTEGPNLPVPFGHGITCTLNFYHGDFSIIGQNFFQVYDFQIMGLGSNNLITRASSLSGNISWSLLQCQKRDCHLLPQKVCQKISVIKTDTFDDMKEIVHFGILIHILS